MNRLDVSAYISLPFTTIIAVRTFEARSFAALVSQVSIQRVLPDEYARTIWTGILLVQYIAAPHTPRLVAIIPMIRII